MATVFSAIIWSLSQIGGEDVRTYLENLLDQLEEDEEQIAFLEEALDNLAFTEDLDRFDLLAFDPMMNSPSPKTRRREKIRNSDESLSGALRTCSQGSCSSSGWR
jgi:hypothetical protein